MYGRHAFLAEAEMGIFLHGQDFPGSLFTQGEMGQLKGRDIKLMRLRPYRTSDFSHIAEWIRDERIHALWCAGTLPYPLSPEVYERAAREDEERWNSSLFIATDDGGTPIGSFQISIDNQANSAFMARIIIDTSIRGRGYGQEMICLARQYAFTVANVEVLRLRAFENNVPAVHCYKRAGLAITEQIEDAYTFQGEHWNVYVMEAKR